MEMNPDSIIATSRIIKLHLAARTQRTALGPNCFYHVSSTDLPSMRHGERFSFDARGFELAFLLAAQLTAPNKPLRDIVRRITVRQRDNHGKHIPGLAAGPVSDEYYYTL